MLAFMYVSVCMRVLECVYVCMSCAFLDACACMCVCLCLLSSFWFMYVNVIMLVYVCLSPCLSLYAYTCKYIYSTNS